MSEDEPTFEGFPPPTKNFFSLPNEMINIIAHITNMAELKVIIYVIRHTWGYHEYGVYKTISVDEFMHGRRKQDGSRMDEGTGLSHHSVIEGLRAAEKHGYLTCTVDTSDLARVKKSYVLKMAVPSADFAPPEEASPPAKFAPSAESAASSAKSAPSSAESSHRSEKDTQERHLEKDTQERENASANAPTRAPAVSDLLSARQVGRNGVTSVTFEDMVAAQAKVVAPAASLEQESETRTNEPDTQQRTIDPPGLLPGGHHAPDCLDTQRGQADASQVGRADTAEGPHERDTGAHDLADAGDAEHVGRGRAEGANDHGQLSEQTSSALSKDGAARTSQSSPRASGGRKPREKPPVKPTQPAKDEPSFALTDEQMAFWKLWCGVWFNADIPPRLNETAYGHVRALAPHVTTAEQLDSLIKHARKELAESQGIKRKTVQLGNLVHCYSGWKQAQIKDEPTSNGLPPQMTREQRKAMSVW